MSSRCGPPSIRVFLLVMGLMLLAQGNSLAQDSTAPSLRVRYVKVQGRWARGVRLAIAPGDLLTSELISETMGELKAVITAESVKGYGLRSLGEVGVLYIEVEYDTSQTPAARGVEVISQEKTAGVIFRPFYVHFRLERVGDNVLPIPRSPWPTIYKSVPAPLLALNPSFTVSTDRAFGTAIGGAIDVELLNLFDPAHHATTAEETRHLELLGHGLKAMEERFYRSRAGLRYSARRHGRLVQEFSVRANHDDMREPQGDSDHTRHAGGGGIGVTLGIAANTRLSLDTGYRRVDDTIDDDALALHANTRAGEQANRLLLDAIPRPMYGFLRSAIWEENGSLSTGGETYHRLAGRLGYGKEIGIQPGQTVGLELVVGGGWASGGTPINERFFGGNETGQFLYDAPSGAQLLATPAGPLIRSFGQAQATVRANSGERRGGDAYWHMNLNVALPIARWSRALIPNETTDLEDIDGNPTTLKQILHRQINVTGPSMMTAVFKQEGMSDAEAAQKAVHALDELKPATHFIIDDASLYSIKPLLMLDVAGLSGRGASSQTWVAAGGGLQLTIVIAKFEAGYMRTVSGPTFGSRENVFARLVFQNLF